MIILIASVTILENGAYFRAAGEDSDWESPESPYNGQLMSCQGTEPRSARPRQIGLIYESAARRVTIFCSEL